jgi:hypothetical protein
MGVGPSSSGAGWDDKYILGFDGSLPDYSLHSFTATDGHGYDIIGDDAISPKDLRFHVADENSAEGTINAVTASSSWPIPSGPYELVIGGQENALADYSWDWVRCRKYSNVEPSFAIGTESGLRWFELYNPTAAPVDLHNWKIVDGSGATVYQYASPTVVPGGYNVQTVSAALGLTGSLALIDPDGVMQDFVAWGTPGSPPSGTMYDTAVASVHWPAASYVDTTGLIAGNTLARDRLSTDTNLVADWDITCGVDAGYPTPITRNEPEFPTVAIPIFLCAIPFIVFRAKRRKPNGGE